jgi:hypothetical protein
MNDSVIEVSKSLPRTVTLYNRLGYIVLRTSNPRLAVHYRNSLVDGDYIELAPAVREPSKSE